ncbi:MAG: ferredoxin-nitrite reductase [Sulfurimonas sp.]|jgi:ferredoxin-nitrite reductase|uniref:nitrite/sulfite reductase n=1 Tax=Sulfurimonas sp. TaxID=2022749 RepID=UPI0039E21C70
MIVKIKENTDKLNWRERNKVNLSPHVYLQNIENIEFSMIADNDRPYLQDAGIYNHEAEHDMFALRLRFNAGRISPEQLLLIAKLVKCYDLHIILTARAQMQLHGLDSYNILTAWKELNENGISTMQTLGDNVRNIVTDVYDGLGKHAEIQTYPYIEQMQDYVLNKPRFIGLLPRRVSVGVSGNRANLNSFFANDLFFALAEKDGVKGFNVYLGGKNSELARDANVFLKQEQIVEYFIAVIEAFHTHGFRGTRGKTRLFHWIEKEGMQGVKELIDKEHVLAYETAGTLLLEKYDKTTSTRLKDNSFVYVYHTDFARVDADTFIKLAEFAQEHKAEVRLGIDQHIYFLGLKSPVTPFENSNTVSTISACAGNEHCNFSFWHIKDDTRYLPLDLIKEHNIVVGFSGCIKGCGKHQHCDIGLIGMQTSTYGPHVEAARIYLGGEHTFGLNVARYLNLIVPKEELSSFLEVIIMEFEHSEYKDFEVFSKEVLNTYSADFLCLWFLAKLSSKNEIFLQKNIEILEDTCSKKEKDILNENFNSVIPSTDFKSSSEISRVSKDLWKKETGMIS